MSSILSTSSHQGEIDADSILGTIPSHSSFMNPNEPSMIAPKEKRRRSIKETDYASLLVSESKPVSSYSSLFQNSELTGLSQSSVNSRPGLAGLTNLSSLHVPSPVSDSSTLSSESIPQADSSIHLTSNNNLSFLTSRLSHANQMMEKGLEQGQVNDATTKIKNLEEFSELRDRLSAIPHKEDSLVPISDRLEKLSMLSTSQGTDTNDTTDNTTESSHLSQKSQSLQVSQKDEMEEEEEQEQEQEQELPSMDMDMDMDMDIGSIDDVNEEDLPGSMNSSEETVIRELLDHQSSKSALASGAMSFLGSLMPPPKQSLRLTIPGKGISRAGRKKGSLGE